MISVRQNGKGEQVFGMLVTVGKRQPGNGEQTVPVGCGGTLEEKPLVGGRPVGSGKPGKDPPGAGAIPVNRLVKGNPRTSVPVTVDVKGKPNPVNRLVTVLPFELVPISVEVKERATPDGVKVPWTTVVNGLPCAFVPVEVKEND